MIKTKDMAAFTTKTMIHLLDMQDNEIMVFKKGRALWNTKTDLTIKVFDKRDLNMAKENIFLKIKQLFLKIGRRIDPLQI